jgi:hypothetical protein
MSRLRAARRPCEYHRNDFLKLARYPFEFDFTPPADGVVRHIGEGLPPWPPRLVSMRSTT